MVFFRITKDSIKKIKEDDLDVYLEKWNNNKHYLAIYITNKSGKELNQLRTTLVPEDDVVEGYFKEKIDKLMNNDRRLLALIALSLEMGDTQSVSIKYFIGKKEREYKKTLYPREYNTK